MRTIRVMGEHLHISASPSFLRTATCPFQLYKKYVEHDKDIMVGVPALRGSAIHEVVAHLTKECTRQGRPVCDIPNEEVEMAVQRFTPYAVLSEIPDILSWAKLWRDRYRISRYHMGAEEWIALDDNFQPGADWHGAPYRGIVDVVNYDPHEKELTVEDYKSQFNRHPQSELETLDQMRFYAWLGTKEYPEARRVTKRIFYLRYGIYDDAVMDRDEIEEYETTLMMRIDKIASLDSWDPRPGEACQYCNYRHKCPVALDTSFEVREIVSQEDAAQAAEKLLVYKLRVKEIEDKLRAHVKTHDNVRINDNYTFGYRDSVRTTWDPEEVRDVLEEYGYNPMDVSEEDAKKKKKRPVLKVDNEEMKRFLKKMWKENDVLAARLEDTKRERLIPTFSGFVDKEG